MMWKNIKNTNLFIKFREEYEIFVTDFVTIWFFCFTKTAFIRSLKESNTLLEMAEDTLFHKGLHVLSNPTDIKNAEQKVENKLLFVSMTALFGYPFKVNLKLFEGSKQLFFQIVTQPLLKTICELKSSQMELCELLNKKDSEIEEYKRMGGEIAIKYLKTKAFDDSVFLRKYPMYQAYFGSTDDTVQSLLEVKLDVADEDTNIKKELVDESPPEMVTSIKIEPTVKMEPDSQTTEEPIPVVSSVININQEKELPIKRETKQETETQSPIKRESQCSIASSSRMKRLKKLNL